ncbi:MmyB family transcriptional regulator [Streptomyces montanisoli]|uniref:MmyB family transcriptional regulator n=1 Tax=Streptomyces montanisoli TaxID=2798581 RepID=UPI0027DDCE6E|nr:DNA-binding protein [Streptomyces montanisoli]
MSRRHRDFLWLPHLLLPPAARVDVRRVRQRLQFRDLPVGAATAALLRAEAGREPRDRALRELVGELSTLSPEFRGHWAAHDVLTRHDGIKRLQHPGAGHLELTFQSLDLPLPGRTVHDLIIYTAEPGTASEERLGLLAVEAATRQTDPRRA